MSNPYKEMFASYLTENDINCFSTDDDTLRIEGDYRPAYIKFDKPEGEYSSLYGSAQVYSSLVTLNNRDCAKGVDICNGLNSRYRFAKFFVEPSNNSNYYITVSADTFFDTEYINVICLSVVSKVLRTINESLPIVANII